MFVISKKCRTLKPQKAKVHYVPYKTSKLEVYFDRFKTELSCQIDSRGLCMAKTRAQWNQLQNIAQQNVTGVSSYYRVLYINI